MPLRRRRLTRCRGSVPATRLVSTTCWDRPCRCRAISSRHRRGFTKPASCSWPISTAIRIILRWSAGRTARARPCISPSCFVWRTRRGCSPIPSSRSRRGNVALKDVGDGRTRVNAADAERMESAGQASMPLAIEPLHPAYAADRACVNTTKQALDLCDALDPDRTGLLGVALDVYHIWWDPDVLPQIERAGKDRLKAFHVCDWLVPTKEILNDRGMMGDGVIDIKRLRGAVEAQGFGGYSEIEIFSNDWWEKPIDEVLQTCIAPHRTLV